MASKESELWHQFSDNLPPVCHCFRIENTLERGTPDVSLTVNGKQYWIELKVQVTNKILIRKEQNVWHFRHQLSGGKSFVFSKILRHNYFVIHSSPFQTKMHNDTYQEITSNGWIFFTIEEAMSFLTIL